MRQCRMTKQSRMTKPEEMWQRPPRGLPFRPRQALDFRHSGFRVSLAFTLLEMLSVIALLALLVALLLPALSRSKASARQIRCAANLRQLGLAAQMYWDDNNGNAFRYRGAATNHGDLYWFGWLARGNEGAREF